MTEPFHEPACSGNTCRSNLIRRFGEAVQKRRSGLGISQEELAERADLHRTYVADIKRGARNPTLLTIKKLATGLGVSGRLVLGDQMKSLAPSKVFPCQLIVSCIVVYGAPIPVRAEDKPPAAKLAQTNSQLTTSDGQSGLLNYWLRSQSSSFSAWDLGGQFRARYEHTENLGAVDFSSKGGQSSTDLGLLRTLVHVGYNPTPWLSLYTEARDSRGLWDEPNPNPDQDTLDLHQAFVRIGNPQLLPLIAKVGRQELIYGDERLVGQSDWTNVRRTFDAAKLRYEVKGFWVDAFVSRPVVVWNDHFNESDSQDWFSGIYASTTKLIPWQESEVYFLARNTSTGSPQFYGPPPDPQGATPRDIYTIGVHFKSLPGKMGGWDYNLEAAGQFGQFKETTAGAPASAAGRNLVQQAYAAVASGGYTWTDAPGKPRAGLEYLYSSGDSNPTDDKHETFDNLFPTNHRQFGIMDIFSWQNDRILRFMGSIQPLESLTLAGDYRLVWLADTLDSFYTNKGARRGGLAPTDGTGYGINPNYNSYVGSEIDLVATYTFKQYTSLQAGIGHFFVGDYVKSSLAGIGGARDATFVYAQFTLNF